MVKAPAFERLLKRDRVITLTGLAALCALAWLYIVTGAGLGMSAWETTTLALFPARSVAVPRKRITLPPTAATGPLIGSHGPPSTRSIPWSRSRVSPAPPRGFIASLMELAGSD